MSRASIRLGLCLLVLVSTARATAQDGGVGPSPDVEPDVATSEAPTPEVEPGVASGAEPPAGLEGEAATLEQSPQAPEDREEEPSVPPPPEEEDPIEITAELGRGVTIGAGDAFSLQIRARIQFQMAVQQFSDAAIAQGAEDDAQIDFQIRRLRLVLAGHVLSRDVRYYIQLGMSPRDMEPDLLVPVRDAYLTWMPHPWIGVRFGQMKVPFGMQRVVSSSALQMVDRSSITAELNLDRDIGLYLMSEDLFSLGGVFQYAVGVMGGRGRNRFGGLDAAMFVGRVQVNPFGTFDFLSEGDHTRSEQVRLAVGASVAYNVDSNRARSTHGATYEFARFDNLHLGADVHLKWAGFTLLSEVMFRESDHASITQLDDAGMPVLDDEGNPIVEESRSAWGWFAQVGYMLPFPLEVVARVGEIRPLTVMGQTNLSLQREVGGAVSYYFQQHALKVQADYFYYWGDDPETERHQVRLQVQLFF